MLIKETIGYQDDNHDLEGWLVYEDDSAHPARGIVIFHGYMGLGPYLGPHLEKLVGLGYVVLAADLYGRGIPCKKNSYTTIRNPPIELFL